MKEEYICRMVEDVITHDFRQELRKKILDTAVVEYRDRIESIIDASLNHVIDARVEMVKNMIEDNTCLEIDVNVRRN